MLVPVLPLPCCGTSDRSLCLSDLVTSVSNGGVIPGPASLSAASSRQQPQDLLGRQVFADTNLPHSEDKDPEQEKPEVQLEM